MPTQIPFVDLGRLHAEMRADLDAAFAATVDASAFTLGEPVERFESEFATFVGVRRCVGVSSGTAALRIMLEAAGVGVGDEVVVPAHTFIASALGVLHAGATPVFCDVEEETGLIDPAAAEAAITPRTVAVLAVHLYGRVCAMEPLGDVCSRRGVDLFEDAAQAHGATYRGQRAGSFGRAAAFSFYPSKNLGALGDGGGITTDDDELATRAAQLRNLGQRAKYDHVRIGATDRLDGLQAAVLSAKLPRLDGWNASRRQAAETLRTGLKGVVRVSVDQEEAPSIDHLFPVRVPDRQALAAALAADGVATGVHYAPALHLQPALRRATSSGSCSASGAFPVAERWAAEELSLPLFPRMTPDELGHVIASCRRAIEEPLTGAGQRRGRQCT